MYGVDDVTGMALLNTICTHAWLSFTHKCSIGGYWVTIVVVKLGSKLFSVLHFYSQRFYISLFSDTTQQNQTLPRSTRISVPSLVY